MTETEETIKILDHIGRRSTVPMMGNTIQWWIRIVSLDDIRAARVVYIEGGFGFADAGGFLDRKRKGLEMLEALAEYPHIAAKLAEPME